MIKESLLVLGIIGMIAMNVACGNDAPVSTPFPSPTPTNQPTPTLSETGNQSNITSTPVATPSNSNSGTNGDSNDIKALGIKLFLEVPDNAAPQALWCSQCHTVSSLDGANGLIGPDLSHIGTDAANRKDGLSAEQYIKESIANPQLFVPQGVERSTPGLMTDAIVDKLTGDQVDALVAFLLAQQ